MKVISVDQELSNRPEGTFLDLVDFNGRSFSACSVTGISPVWEMHPDTDEYFHILEGEFVMLMREPEGFKEYKASAGQVFVVPQGVWHKPGAPEGARFMYFTPGQSLHSEAEDPLNTNTN